MAQFRSKSALMRACQCSTGMGTHRWNPRSVMQPQASNTEVHHFHSTQPHNPLVRVFLPALSASAIPCDFYVVCTGCIYIAARTVLPLPCDASATPICRPHWPCNLHTYCCRYAVSILCRPFLLRIRSVICLVHPLNPLTHPREPLEATALAMLSIT